MLFRLSYRSVVGPEGIKPSTVELKVPCSVTELRSRVEVRGTAGFYRHLNLLVDRVGIEPTYPEGRPIYSRVQRPLLRTIRGPGQTKKATRFPRWPSRHRCRCGASSPGASGIFLAETLEATRDFPDQGARARIQRCR